MKFVVRIKRRHLKKLTEQWPGSTPTEIFRRALAIGLNHAVPKSMGFLPAVEVEKK